MNRVVFEIRVVAAALANVPPRGYFAARACARAVFKRRPDLVEFSEAWWPWTYRAILDVAPDWYRFVRVRKRGGRRGSVVIAYDSRVFEELARGVIVLHGDSPWWDVREMPWLTLRHRKSGRVIRFGGLHLSPPGTRHGDAAEDASRADHLEAEVEIVRFTAATDRVTLFAGDTNESGVLLPSEVVGRMVRQVSAPPHYIDKVIAVDGEHATVRILAHATFPLRKSDHPGFVVDLEVAA